METCDVALTFESVCKILWCDNSNQTFSSTFTWYHFFFTKLNLGFFLSFDVWHSWEHSFINTDHSSASECTTLCIYISCKNNIGIMFLYFVYIL